MNNRIFLLGAEDPELVAIRQVLTDAGEQWVNLMKGGYRVTPRTAYEAEPVQALKLAHMYDPEVRPVVYLVEGRPEGLSGFETVVIDHHHPGDPGYGKPPAQYTEASSLGQVHAVINLGLTQDERMCAAADHCLRSAYEGKCPGVTPTALALWRAKSRSKFIGVSLEEYQEQVNQARAKVLALPTIKIKGHPFRDARDQQIKELPEASAQMCTAVLYATPPSKGKFKEGVLSGTPKEIRLWKYWATSRGANELSGVYGDPERGIAGGFGTVDYK